MGDGAECGDFPIAEMAREDDRRLAVIPELIEDLIGARAELDPAGFFRMIDVVIPDVIEMGELGADAAEIVPNAGENLLDLLRRFLGEGGLQILAADAVLAQSAADEQRGAAEEVGGLVGIEQACGAQQRDREAADRGLADRL